MWWAFLGLQVRCLVSWCDYGFFLEPPVFFSFFFFLFSFRNGVIFFLFSYWFLWSGLGFFLHLGFTSFLYVVIVLMLG